MREAKVIPFGKYELLERLGVGGMAAVYRARYTAAPGVIKPVVIKRVLGQHAENPTFVEMLIQEARISVGLSHGNIVQVFDFGQVNGEYFLAMELVDGQPLSRVLKRGQALGLARLPAPLAVSIAIELCKGLHHAHTRTDEHGRRLGIVHRDVTPDNVLVSYEGEVKLADFGIAKAQLAGSVETEAGVVKGKYLFLSPEQARGEALDARSDVYAVGVVLYRMLCGRLPAEGRQFEVLERIARGQLTSPLELDPELDPLLVQILHGVLTPSRDKRPESAEALRHELSRWLAQRAPLFAPNTLKHLMEWLYTPELTERGQPPELPHEFRDQLALWCSAPVAPRQAGREWEEAEPALLEEARRPETKSHPSASTPAPEKSRAPWAWGLAALVLTLGFLGVFLGGRPPPPLEIRSEPPGAQVRFDGVIVGVTPVVLEGVERDRNHRVELVLLGRPRWEQRFAPGSLEARLEVMLPTPEARTEPVRVPALQPGGEERFGTRQVPARFTLTEAVHAVSPTGRSLRLELDPSRTYTVWTTGRHVSNSRVLAWAATRAGPPPQRQEFRQAYLFLEGPEVPAEARLRAASPTPRTVSGATALDVFVLFEEAVDQIGSVDFALNVRDETTQTVVRTELNTRRYALHLPQEVRYTVRQLDPRRRYVLELRPVKGTPVSPVATVVVPGDDGLAQVSQQPEGELQLVLPPDRYTVSGARELWFVLPRWKEDGEAELEVSLTPEPAAPRSSLRITAAANPSPTVASMKYKQGLERLARRQYRQAKELFWQCLANDPTASWCFRRLGEVSVRLGDTAEALEYYGRFLELAPNAEGAQEARDYIELRGGPTKG